MNSALDAAQSAMTEAKVALEKPDVPAAKFGEALALEKLYAAQGALEAAVAQAQQAMGPQPNEPPNAAAQQSTAAQLAQAQQQIAQANEVLQQAQKPGQPAAAPQQAAQKAAAALTKAAAQAGQAAAQAMPANGPAQQAAQSGAQAAAKAAAAAAGQNLPEAQAQAQAAQQALAQAQASLMQAQAGLTAANGSPALPGFSGEPRSREAGGEARPGSGEDAGQTQWSARHGRRAGISATHGG
ncbi:MAG: hypothetical protein WDN28_30095 [Chthoniobacter sp.]